MNKSQLYVGQGVSYKVNGGYQRGIVAYVGQGREWNKVIRVRTDGSRTLTVDKVSSRAIVRESPEHSVRPQPKRRSAKQDAMLTAELLAPIQQAEFNDERSNAISEQVAIVAKDRLMELANIIEALAPVKGIPSLYGSYAAVSIESPSSIRWALVPNEDKRVIFETLGVPEEWCDLLQTNGRIPRVAIRADVVFTVIEPLLREKLSFASLIPSEER